MQRTSFAGLFLASLLIASGGGAKTTSDEEKPVWTMESIKVKPGMFDFTLRYLDDHWMRLREEGKRQGVILTYHRIVEQDSRESERVALTRLGALSGPPQDPLFDPGHDFQSSR